MNVSKQHHKSFLGTGEWGGAGGRTGDSTFFRSISFPQIQYVSN